MEGTTQNTWPESYYSEKDPGLRRILLEEEIRQHPGVSENDLRQKLWEIRYVSRDKKKHRPAGGQLYRRMDGDALSFQE